MTDYAILIIIVAHVWLLRQSNKVNSIFMKGYSFWHKVLVPKKIPNSLNVITQCECEYKNQD